MSIWSIDDVLKGTNGKLLQKGTRPFEGVTTDTRKIIEDRIFFALKGPNFDAHEFAGFAAEQGASALIVDKDIPKVSSDVTVISVDNTLEALKRFGLWHRNRWQGKIVAITGSNGKTTTKDFTAAILRQKFPVLATEGNLNNNIGVPLTLLELRKQHRFAVIELGMNHYGEITELAHLSRPDVVLVTNVGTAHIEFFGTRENIAKAKEELYDSAPEGATRVYNLDNSYTATMRARAPGTGSVLTYSSYARDVNVSFKEKLFTLEYIDIQGVINGEPGQARIPAFGRQQVANAMAASCIALACGLDALLVWQGLKNCKTTWGRGQIVDLESGAKVLFDAYNANPESVEAAIENFSKLACRGKKYIVFGDMLELGETSKRAHQEVGERIALANPEAVLLLGEHAPNVEWGMRSKGYKKKLVVSNTYEEKLASSFGSVLETGDVVLIKGSRGMKLERVLETWHPQNFARK